MGIFKGNNSLIGNCRLETGEDGQRQITCDAQKIQNGKTIGSQRPVKIGIESGKFQPVDDGGLPKEVVEDVKSYAKKFFKPSR